MIKKIENIAKFEKELQFYNKGYNAVIGIDEVGRGPLAGPVVASACTLRYPEKLKNIELNFIDELWKYVKDSKKLTHKKREEVFGFIEENFFTGTGIINSETIDRINILQATFLAMKSAVEELYRKNKLSENCILLIDGNKIIPNISRKQICIIGGDNTSKSIAAASIISKIIRDNIMTDYDKLFPEYGFAKHKGYGTKIHIEALREFGVTSIHRKSFGPVKNLLKN